MSTTTTACASTHAYYIRSPTFSIIRRCCRGVGISLFASIILVLRFTTVIARNLAVRVLDWAACTVNFGIARDCKVVLSTTSKASVLGVPQFFRQCVNVMITHSTFRIATTSNSIDSMSEHQCTNLFVLLQSWPLSCIRIEMINANWRMKPRPCRPLMMMLASSLFLVFFEPFVDVFCCCTDIVETIFKQQCVNTSLDHVFLFQ
mmetsp:Transcript_29280/g.48395  ORF Transcript_29280/g.48395 Transcript_29280/m.48395 type:complete len:204 (-) Transcript_29280:54-665(-)